jgi:hypothetical protein
MCASAISLSRIRRVYFCLEDKKSGGLINGAKLSYSNNLPILMNDANLDLKQSVNNYTIDVNRAINLNRVVEQNQLSSPELPEKVDIESEKESQDYVPGTPMSLEELAEPLRITEEQKQYKLADGEESEMPEITQEEINDPSKFFYIKKTNSDGSIIIINRYERPYDIITMLSKDDQRYIIQQPFKIQYKILNELAEKQKEKLIEQKRLFDEGKVKTPFLNRKDPNAPESPQYPNVSPAYVPNSNSPPYANVSPAYVPGSSSNESVSQGYSPTFITTKTNITNNESEPAIKPPSILEVQSSVSEDSEKSNNKKEEDSSSEEQQNISNSESNNSSSSNNETRKISI